MSRSSVLLKVHFHDWTWSTGPLNIRYADADNSIEGLQDLFNGMRLRSLQYGLDINLVKTTPMICSRVRYI